MSYTLQERLLLLAIVEARDKEALLAASDIMEERGDIKRAESVRLHQHCCERGFLSALYAAGVGMPNLSISGKSCMAICQSDLEWSRKSVERDCGR